MPIYTKEGDQGKTRLFGSSEKIAKSEPIFSLIGTIDEANSHLGLAVALINPDLPHANILKNKITQVQDNLFKLGGILAGAKLSIPFSVISKYEREIDTWIKIIPQRKNFILPGGSVCASEIFVARSVVRRMERELVEYAQDNPVKPGVLVFANRLSDYLYVLARYINFQEGKEEIIWKK